MTPLVYRALSVVFFGIAGAFGLAVFALGFAVLGDAQVMMMLTELGEDWPVPPTLGLIGLILLCMTASAIFAGIGRRMAQVPVDAATSDVVEAALRGEPARFALYLRPFETTGALLFGDAAPAAAFPGMGAFSAHDADFEYQLRRALRNTYPVIGLGRPGEHVGVGRFKTTHENWREVAMRLIEAAAIIFCVPGPRPGTLWELERLLAAPALRSKTVFFLPPTEAGVDYAEAWRETNRLLEPRGVRLPPPPAGPQAFVITGSRADGSWRTRPKRLISGSESELRACAALVDPAVGA